MPPDPATDLLAEMRRLLGDAGDLERRVRQATARQVTAPFDAIFTLLAESGTTMRRQAEAMEAAGRALEEAASLMKAQALLFEKSIGALRQPLDIAERVTGVERRPPNG